MNKWHWNKWNKLVKQMALNCLQNHLPFCSLVSSTVMAICLRISGRRFFNTWKSFFSYSSFSKTASNSSNCLGLEQYHVLRSSSDSILNSTGQIVSSTKIRRAMNQYLRPCLSYPKQSFNSKKYQWKITLQYWITQIYLSRGMFTVAFTISYSFAEFRGANGTMPILFGNIIQGRIYTLEMVDGRASLTTKYISTFVTNSAMIIVLLYVSCWRNKKKCCKKKRAKF